MVRPVTRSCCGEEVEGLQLQSILFRVDTGPQSGLGHLQRCLSLAMALHRLGAKPIFLTGEHLNVQQRIGAFNFSWVGLSGARPGSHEDLECARAAAVSFGAAFAVVDSYHVDEGYFHGLRAAGLFVAAIDDLAAHAFPCQLVVNGGAHAYQLSYLSSSGDTRFLLGPRYALLRPEFWSVPRRTVRDAVQNILVTLGGADSGNLMPRVLGLLSDLPGDFAVTAIVGPFFEKRREVEAAAERCRRSVRLVYDPYTIRDLMLDADMAVSAGGQTLYELAATGTPMVAVQVADNQATALRVLAVEGVACMVEGQDGSVLIDRLGKAVLRLLKSYGVRVEMSAAGLRLVDGWGAQRVSEEFPLR